MLLILPICAHPANSIVISPLQSGPTPFINSIAVLPLRQVPDSGRSPQGPENQ